MHPLLVVQSRPVSGTYTHTAEQDAGRGDGLLLVSAFTCDDDDKVDYGCSR